MKYDKILNDAVDFSFSLISIVSDVKCMGLRLQNKSRNNDYPFYRQVGYSKSFLSKVDCIRNEKNSAKLDCLCGQVIQGPDPILQSNFSHKGTYWRNYFERDFYIAHKDRLRLKDACLDEGFESIALIPVKDKKDCKGLFHIADQEKDKFDTQKIDKLELIAKNFSQLVLGIEQFITEKGPVEFKVLVVEDEFELNSLLGRMLKTFHFQCDSAYDGVEAFDYLCRNKVDLVLTDINMPNMTGIELVRKIREQFKVYGPKVVVLSAYPEEITLKIKKELDISDVISKPVDLITLKNILDYVMN